MVAVSYSAGVISIHTKPSAVGTPMTCRPGGMRVGSKKTYRSMKTLLSLSADALCCLVIALLFPASSLSSPPPATTQGAPPPAPASRRRFSRTPAWIVSTDVPDDPGHTPEIDPRRSDGSRWSAGDNVSDVYVAVNQPGGRSADTRHQSVCG